MKIILAAAKKDCCQIILAVFLKQ